MSRKQTHRVIGKRLFDELRYVAAAHGMEGPEAALRQIVRDWVGPNPYERYDAAHFQQIAAARRSAQQ